MYSLIYVQRAVFPLSERSYSVISQMPLLVLYLKALCENCQTSPLKSLFHRAYQPPPQSLYIGLPSIQEAVPSLILLPLFSDAFQTFKFCTFSCFSHENFIYPESFPWHPSPNLNQHLSCMVNTIPTLTSQQLPQYILITCLCIYIFYFAANC